MPTQHAPPDTATSGSALHGRRDELDRIERLLGDARVSRGGALVVSGEAGIGKSALLDAARERASGMLVLSCRGIESEARLPFAALHQLLRPVLGHVNEIPATQGAALRCALGLERRAGPEPFLISLAALSVLAAAAEERPLLCLVDDAQWLDGASADVLAFVARRLDADPIAMLFALRQEDEERVEALGLAQLPLSGLDAAAARAVVGASALVPEVADWVVRAAEGNPLALLELAAGLSDGQRAGIEPILGPPPIGADLERAFLERVHRLPAPTQLLLLVAAAEETGELETVLEAAAWLAVPAAALDDAERAGLARVSGTQLELRHPLVRSAIYHGAPLSERRTVHDALAAVLVGEEKADRRAWHRAAASLDPDPAVVDELEQLAQRAHARGGYEAASLALERAAALADDERRRAQLLTAAADNAWLPGKRPRALELLRRARAMDSEPAVRTAADRLLGVIELTCGVPADATQTLRAAAGRMATAHPDHALELLSLASWGAALTRDGEAVVAIAGDAERLEVADTPVNRFLRERLAGLRAHFAHDYDGAASHLTATVELAGDPATEALPDRLGLINPVGLFLCDERAVIDLHRRAAEWARQSGRLTLLAQALPWVALGEIWSGRWPSASASVAHGLELARETNQDQIAAHLVAIGALLAAHRGQETDCRALAAESLERAAARRLVHVTACATWALTALEVGLGRPQEALVHVRALHAAAGVDWDALDRIEAAARSGERDAATAWLDAFEPWARGSGAPWGQAVALHCRALLEEDHEEAERLFTAALEAHERAGRPFERARTELAFGELLRRARQRSRSRTHLRAAVERFEALDATLWADRARAELRATGEVARKRDPSTLDQLTAQEAHIVALVAEGLTNRDVAGQLLVSPRTIDFHLRNVFRKLGITSRSQLARMDLAAPTATADR